MDDASNGDETPKTSRLIRKQKKQLTRMLIELNEMSELFDGPVRRSFRQLVKESKKVLPKRSFGQLEPNKLTNHTDKEQFETEVNSLISKSRALIKQLENNLRIKTRVSCDRNHLLVA